ncbi:hypothetical protein L1887_00318 [Cichorium endivia]|nr:hypothetical protein L1887_00318 [Cichorium endivia]
MEFVDGAPASTWTEAFVAEWFNQEVSVHVTIFEEMERGKMEKETQTLKANPKREVWDCESSLYDSFELKSFERQLDSAISTRTMSMPHLSSSSSSSSLRHQPPPPFDHKPTSKKPFRLTRSLNKIIRSVFRTRHNNHNSSRDGAFYVYDTSSALSTIPEVPETVPDFDRLSPDMKSLVTRAGSERFMPSSVGISCA